MKVSKKYKDLTQMYHFNPIGDPSLFTNMETQHFYSEEDKKFKQEDMFQYIYWYNDKELLQRKYKPENVIIKDGIYHKYITNNIPILEEWSGKEYNTVLFDSDIDGDDCELLHSIILEHSSLYFIVIDTEYNIFGHYHPSKIDKKCSF